MRYRLWHRSGYLWPSRNHLAVWALVELFQTYSNFCWKSCCLPFKGKIIRIKHLLCFPASYLVGGLCLLWYDGCSYPKDPCIETNCNSTKVADFLNHKLRSAAVKFSLIFLKKAFVKNAQPYISCFIFNDSFGHFLHIKVYSRIFFQFWFKKARHSHSSYSKYREILIINRYHICPGKNVVKSNNKIKKKIG